MTGLVMETWPEYSAVNLQHDVFTLPKATQYSSSKKAVNLQHDTDNSDALTKV